jgi:hypothetical protein
MLHQLPAAIDDPLPSPVTLGSPATPAHRGETDTGRPVAGRG